MRQKTINASAHKINPTYEQTTYNKHDNAIYFPRPVRKRPKQTEITQEKMHLQIIEETTGNTRLEIEIARTTIKQ